MLTKKVLDQFEQYCIKNNITGKEKNEKLEKLKELMFKYNYEP